MVVSRVVEQHRFISHERIYFNAQLHTSHIHSTPLFLLRHSTKGWVLFFPWLCLCPLKAPARAPCDTVPRVLYQIHMNSFDRKLSPFVLGLLSSPELVHPYSWHDFFEDCDITLEPASSSFSHASCMTNPFLVWLMVWTAAAKVPPLILRGTFLSTIV